MTDKQETNKDIFAPGAKILPLFKGGMTPPGPAPTRLELRERYKPTQKNGEFVRLVLKSLLPSNLVRYVTPTMVYWVLKHTHYITLCEDFPVEDVDEYFHMVVTIALVAAGRADGGRDAVELGIFKTHAPVGLLDFMEGAKNSTQA